MWSMFFSTGWVALCQHCDGLNRQSRHHWQGSPSDPVVKDLVEDALQALVGEDEENKKEREGHPGEQNCSPQVGYRRPI